MDTKIEEAFAGMITKAEEKSGEDNEEFMHWFRARIEHAAMVGYPPRGYVTPVNVFEQLLGVSRRSYRYWENTFPDYPCPEQQRMTMTRNSPRVYTQDDAVAIAWWHYGRAVSKRSRIKYYTAQQVAGLLRTDEDKVIAAMREGTVPGDYAEKRVSEDEFNSWLAARISL